MRDLVARLSFVLGLVVLAACGSSSPSSGFPTDGGTGAPDATAGDAGVTYTIRIDPPSAAQTIVLGVPPGGVAFRAYAKPPGGAETEITATASWGIVQGSMGTIAAGAVKLAGIGGKTLVSVSWQGGSATAGLTVELTGDVFGVGTDPTTKTAFGGAPPDPNAANAPVLEYPEDGAVLPSNLPPVQPQWSQVSDNDTYRARFTSPGVLDVAVYSKARELAIDAATWKAIGASTYDAPTQLAVNAVGPTKLLRTSAPRSLTITADALDNSAVYVWRSSTGSFRVLDIVNGTDIPLPSNAPALQAGQPCAGCHRISRDGKRFAYTFNGGNLEQGALSFDPVQKLFAEKIAPVASIRGTYAAFNPLEAQTRPAMLLTVPQSVTPNTQGSVQLTVVDPDTNAAIPSNFDQIPPKLTTPIGAMPLTTMPDWSPAGDFVTFVSHDGSKNFVRLLGDDVVLGSIVEAPVSYDGATKSFAFGQPDVLVQSPLGADGDTGENNVLPSISPDGSAVAFTRAAGYWSIKSQTALLNLSGQIMIVRRKDKQVFSLVRGSNGPGTVMNSTWPQWAPTFGQRYAWLAYTSERPYGHILTPSTPQNAQCNFVQGQHQCKQLWIMAIDLGKLATGSADPSLPAFWVPGQDTAAQYVSPQWTKAVLPPPK